MDHAFSPDGKTLATGCMDGAARLSDVATGVVRFRLLGHTEPVNAVRFSADGKTLFTGSFDGTVRVWEVATGRETRVLDRIAGVTFGLSVSPDGKTLAFGYEELAAYDRAVRFLDTESGRLLHERRQRSAESSFAAAFSPDGKWHAEDSGVLRVASTATWGTQILGQDDAAPRALAFSPDGRTLAAGLGDGRVRLWRTAPGEGPAVLRGHGATVTSIAYFPDGRTLVTGSLDGSLRLWDQASGRQIRVIWGHSGPVHQVAVSRDGKAVASGSR